MDNYVERIRQCCKDRNISVAKLEEDLGYGNGFLNPKKVSDIKFGRLLEILDYIGISYEEFMGIGSPETQAIHTALIQIKKVSPETYEEIITAWKNGNEKTATNDGDGNESELTDGQKELMQLIPLLNDQETSVLLPQVKGILSGH